MSRIYLSPPDVGPGERQKLLDAFDSNWIAPLGPEVTGFEADFAAHHGVEDAVALASGTAALHLALILLDVGPGDEVLVPTLAFAAVPFAVRYVGAEPAFLDSETASWNLDPALLADELALRAARDALPAAVMAIDLYGQCADWDAIVAACARYEVPVIEDAAEALGATYRDRPAGTLADIGIYSFNGNKVITTSGGGMLVARDPKLTERARRLASQAREPVLHYEHAEIGYSYRLSNLLAALGREQLRGLDAKVAARRAIHARYRDRLAGVPGIGFQPVAAWGRPSHWLTVVTVDREVFGAAPPEICATLDALDIEVRPAWKPMHLQPVFAGCAVRGGLVAEAAYEVGLCLPSGSSLTESDQDRVVEALLATARP